MRTAFSVIKDFRKRLVLTKEQGPDVTYTDYLLAKELDKLLKNEKFVDLCNTIVMDRDV